MFAPLIIKYSDKTEITKEDLDNALLVNDKENQTTFYSPIREKHRCHMITDKHITTQKKNFHQEMKACKSFEIFPLEGCSASTPFINKSSPLVKLVQYVQSPKFHGKSLMKTNRDLEKSVKQLEDQLFWNENELDKTVNDWKRKCKNLESEVKEMRSILSGKDALIAEKSQEIEQLWRFSEQNKRMDEKLKDYQEKLEEIRVLNMQFEQKCEENRILKIENRESRHFKALAIDRRIKIENLSVDLNNYKHMVSELTETNARLSETESQLTELQNHMHSLQRNANNDSISEISLNSSLLNPESLFGIVEMERDSLRNELELAKENISNLTTNLDETNLRMEQIFFDQQNFNEFVDIIKGDIGQVGLANDVNLCTNSVLKDLKEIFFKMNNEMSMQNESITELTNQLNNIMKINNELEDIVASNKENLIRQNIEFEQKFKENKENVTNAITAEFNAKINDLVTEYDRKELKMKNDISRLVEDCQESHAKLENTIRTYEDQINMDNERLGDSKRTIIVLEEEIKSLKHQAAFVDYKIDDLLKDLQEQSKETSSQKLRLKESSDALSLKEKEICDLDRILKESQGQYQECLTSLTQVSSEFEEALKMKNVEMQDHKTEINKLQNEIDILKKEVVTVNAKRRDLSIHLDEINKKISLKNLSISEELLNKEEMISKLRKMIEEVQDKYQLSSLELDKLQLIHKEYKLLKIEFDKICTESLESNVEIEKLKTELLSKTTFSTQITENHLQEMEKLVSGCKGKDEKIFELQQEVDCTRHELISNEKRILELQCEQRNMNEIFRRNSEELDNMKNINSELELTYKNVKENSSQVIEKIQCELRSTKADLEKYEAQLNSLLKDLVVKNNELESCLENIAQLQLGLENEKSKKITELARIQEELDKNALMLEKKDKELKNANDVILKLEMSVENSNKELNDSRVQCEYLMVIDEKYVQLTKDHLELERRFNKSNNAYYETDRLKSEEIKNLKAALEHLKIKDNEERAEKIRQLNQELTSSKSRIDILEKKNVQINDEYRIQFDKLLNEKSQVIQVVNERDQIINDLKCQIIKLEGQEKHIHRSLIDYSDKIVTLEKTVSDQDKTTSSMEQSINLSSMEITRLNELLKTSDNEKILKDEEILIEKEQIIQMELKHAELNSAISRLNELVIEYEQNRLITDTEISNIQRKSSAEILSLQAVIAEQNQKLEALNSRIKNLIDEKEVKINELTKAHVSLEEFNGKILNLESIIQDEMVNYEKVNEEYKHIEQESNQYKEKYNKLLKLNHDESCHYQSTVSEFTNKINKIEEERDDQIHEMEKTFNSKIYDLQQNFEDKSLEIESMKAELIETRKTSKAARVNLELEKERLQKSLLCRQQQLSEEKAQLDHTLVKERGERLKCNEHYEDVINRLENALKDTEEKRNTELREAKQELDKLNEQLQQAQKTSFRTVEELKQKELEFKHDKDILQFRIKELEPLEVKIENLESTTHRLLTKLTELESSETIKEMKRLRLECNSSLNEIKTLEKENHELLKKNKELDRKVKHVVYDYKETMKVKNELHEKIGSLQDQIRNLESLGQTKMRKIEDIESEISSIKSENESLKSRYLKLREISDSHLEKVIQSHEETVTNYIERIGTLTKDIANFQEQMQFLTVKKNMLNEDNCSLKRSVAELVAKLNSLKTILREHTEKEMRQMSGKCHENTRYTRMSQWANRPQLTRQLPPVDQLDNETVLAIGLNPVSKTRFESFVFSPYSCEDEQSISFHRQFSQTSSKRIEVTRKTEINDTIPQIITPLKKKKAGIRQQITTKIRKSLHLEGIQDSKSTDKSAPDLVSQSSSGQKNPLSSLSKSSGKPPIMPQKKIVEKLKSSQVTIIDLDEYRQRSEKKESVKPIKRKKNQEIITISSTTELNMVDSTSICSLFEYADNSRLPIVSTESPIYQNPDNEVRSLDSPFTQRPKTPKPNSIIKRLIRKSRLKTPKKKLGPIDKLLQ